MNYIEARDYIQSGDLLMVEGGTFWSKITQFVQRLGGQGSDSVVTHCGIAWWLEGRLYIVEMDGKKNVLTALSTYKGINIRWFRHPANPQKMRAFFSTMTQNKIDYSQWDNLKIGLRLVFRLKINTPNSGMDCSNFVVKWLRAAGAQIDCPQIPSPSEVAKCFPNYALIEG